MTAVEGVESLLVGSRQYCVNVVTGTVKCIGYVCYGIYCIGYKVSYGLVKLLLCYFALFQCIDKPFFICPLLVCKS